MKKRTVVFFLLACLAAALAAPAWASPLDGGWTGVYENVSQAAEGLRVVNSIFTDDQGRRVESFTLEASGHVRPIVATGEYLHAAAGPEAVAEAARARGLNVLAAVNADFFYSSVTLPIGAVIEDGKYLSDVGGENLLAFTDEGAFFSRAPEVTMSLHNHGGGAEARNEGKTVAVQNLNKIRVNAGGVFLYTAAYHPDRTVTTRPGWAVRFRILSGELTVSGEVELEVAEVLPQCRDIPIGEGFMVLTCALDGDSPEGYGDFDVGDRVTLVTVCSDPRLASARWATGCGDLIVENGQVTDPSGWDGAISGTRYARTAFGVKADGTAVALVVDGVSANSAGATMAELAERMRASGCAFAVNLSGGGSSAMVLRRPGEEGFSTLRPAAGSAKKSSTYILFVSDEVPDGTADRLSLGEDGALVLSGASMPLTVLATDAGSPIGAPEGVTLTAETGTIAGGVYTAGTAGADTVTLRLADGTALGTGTIHVVDRLDSLTVTDPATGKAPRLTGLSPGDAAALAVSGRVLGRSVLLDGAPVRFTATEGLGVVTEDGLFTATGASAAEGTVTVTAGGVTATLPVSVDVRYFDTRGHWGEAYINYLYDRGVLDRPADRLLGPDGAMRRWEVGMMLWRTVGSPVLGGTCRFTDVSPDSAYYDAVVWGERVGLLYGTEADRFDPEGELTREQAFTLIYRLLKLFRKELPAADPGVLEAFPDGGEVSDYAREAVTALVSAGFVGGSDGLLLPQGSVTRAQLCKVICEAVLGWTLSKKAAGLF